MNKQRELAVSWWVPGILILLLAIGLTGCPPAPEPTSTPTSTPEPTFTPTPTPEPASTPTPVPTPEAPVIHEPVGPNITVQAGKVVAVRAGAQGADGYRWELQGVGEISKEEGDTTIYTAPEQVPEGGAVAVLAVTAYNQGGESATTSLIIAVEPSSPEITITLPHAEVECPLTAACEFIVSGTSKSVTSDYVIYAFVGDPPGVWWPYWIGAPASDGTWQGTARIGGDPCVDPNHEVELVVMALPRDVAGQLAPPLESPPVERVIAQSDFVKLVTSHPSMGINLSSAEPSAAEDDEITNVEIGESRLAFDYTLNRDWVQVAVPFARQDWSCVKENGFSVTFLLEGDTANTLEVKLEDSDLTTYIWRQARATRTDGQNQFTIPLDYFDYGWDADNRDIGMNWAEVVKLGFAVSIQDGVGGSGHVEISDVRLVLPTP